MAHGRKGMTNSVNAGAPTTGSAFPNTNPALFADAGETMAEARGRIMCGGACELSVDLAFKDYWLATPPTTRSGRVLRGRPEQRADRSGRRDHKFTCLNSLPRRSRPLLPAATCRANPNNLCRITIHYEQHIHPLWGVDRFVDANGDGVPDVDGAGVPLNNKCNSCHAPVNAAGMAAVPAGDST